MSIPPLPARDRSGWHVVKEGILVTKKYSSQYHYLQYCNSQGGIRQVPLLSILMQTQHPKYTSFHRP
jgi:hypothetical protein